MKEPNSKPSSEVPPGNGQSNNEKKSTSALLSSSGVIGFVSLVGAFISLVGVIAFCLSWLYVESLSDRFHFPFKRYFELIDYVQVTPSLISVLIISSLIIVLVGIPLVALTIAFDSPVKKTSGIKAAGTLSVILFFILINYVKYWAEQSTRTHVVGEGISRVVCKSSQPDLEGRLIFQLNRYVILFVYNSPSPMLVSVVAIPQAEVCRIETILPKVYSLPPDEEDEFAKPSPTPSPSAKS